MPTDHPSLADLERAVEEAWVRLETMEDSYPYVGMSWARPLLDACRNLRAARRAARDAGMVSVLVRKSTLDYLRDTSAVGFTQGAGWTCRQFADDLAAVLAPDGE